jgi:isopenicillin N synthase-like dioxygenase
MGSVGPTYDIPPYERPPPTQEDLDWARLVTIDVSRFDEPGEKERLAAQLDDTICNVGFWIVTGHGIPDDEVERMLAIGHAFFQLPMEEKVKVPIDLGNDLNWGYREPVRELGDSGWKESVETVRTALQGRRQQMGLILVAHEFHSTNCTRTSLP